MTYFFVHLIVFIFFGGGGSCLHIFAYILLAYSAQKNEYNDRGKLQSPTYCPHLDREIFLSLLLQIR